MKIRAILVAALPLALAACGHSSDPPPVPFPIPVPSGGSTWSLRYSPGMPATMSAANSLAFPTGNGCPGPKVTTVPTNNDGPCHHVDYATRPPIPLHGSLTLTYTITGNPVFGSDTHVNEVSNGAGSPPHITFIIDASTIGGDPYLANPTLRWYAVPAGGDLTLGTHTVTMPLTFANWGDAGGPAGTQAQFNAVLARYDSIGICFGGGAFAQCHGLYLKSGSATFTVNSFTSP